MYTENSKTLFKEIKTNNWKDIYVHELTDLIPSRW